MIPSHITDNKTPIPILFHSIQLPHSFSKYTNGRSYHKIPAPSQLMVKKLTVQLLDTYRHIHNQFYAQRAKMSTHPPKRKTYHDLFSTKINKLPDLYCDQSSCVNFDSARRSKIEAKRSERGRPFPVGKADEEDRFGKVAARQNSHNLSGRSISKFIQ